VFPVAVAFELELPPDPQVSQSPWDLERDFWQSRVLQVGAAESLGDRDQAVQIARARYDAIEARELGVDDGMADGLFLPSARAADYVDGSSQLVLQSGFGFWGFGYKSLSPTQADVFVTVVAALNYLRTPHGSMSAALNQDHNVVLLDPENFDRYSDGVVQAAFLRAAKPEELDYSNEPLHSAAMLDVITRASSEADPPGGSALMEFLLAIALGSLRLEKGHLEQLIASVGAKQISAPVTLLVELIQQDLLGL
jgi:hypothetical protein